MNPNIPDTAAKLLDLIGNTEAPRGYGTLFGNHQGDLQKPLTTMTLSEIISSGPTWTSKYRSSACGRYQFMTATLKSLRVSEHLSGSELFSADFQDTLGYALLDRRGFEKFLIEALSTIDFGLGLAKEWASFPVLSDCQGANRPVKRGETYYAGDAINRALIKPEEVEAALSHATVATVSRSASMPLAAVLTDDANLVPKLIELGSDPQSCALIRDKAFQAMTSIYGHPRSHNACACTLSMFLRAAGMNISVEYGAGNLAKALERDRGWKRLPIGQQRPGDVAVALDQTSPAGADHIFLVIQTFDADRMMIADNQTANCPHERFASGKGKTPVDYFLRAVAAGSATMALRQNENDDSIANEDEDTNGLVVRFSSDGTRL